MRHLLVSALSAKALVVGSGLALALPAAPAAAQQWQDITCESWNYREAVCPVPGAVRVQLLRVRGGQCVEGESWYHDGNALHVRNGCRAVFRIDANSGWGTGGWDPNWQGGGGRSQILRCESWNFRDQICPVGGVIASARLLRVLGGDCRDGATWRWDRRALYVRNGCRAEFEVLRGSSGWGGGGGWGNDGNWNGGGWNGGGRPVARINCESWNYRPANCAIPNARGVQIDRVLGGTCVEGRSWGWNRNRIWVKDGCRASFNVF